MFKPLSIDEMEQLTSRPPPVPGSEDAGEAESVWNTVRDLHLEIIFMYHRVCLKLVSLGPGESGDVMFLSLGPGESGDVMFLTLGPGESGDVMFLSFELG